MKRESDFRPFIRSPMNVQPSSAAQNGMMYISTAVRPAAPLPSALNSPIASVQPKRRGRTEQPNKGRATNKVTAASPTRNAAKTKVALGISGMHSAFPPSHRPSIPIDTEHSIAIAPWRRRTELVLHIDFQQFAAEGRGPSHEACLVLQQ